MGRGPCGRWGIVLCKENDAASRTRIGQAGAAGGARFRAPPWGGTEQWRKNRGPCNLRSAAAARVTTGRLGLNLRTRRSRADPAGTNARSLAHEPFFSHTRACSVCVCAGAFGAENVTHAISTQQRIRTQAPRVPANRAGPGSTQAASRPAPILGARPGVLPSGTNRACSRSGEHEQQHTHPWP